MNTEEAAEADSFLPEPGDTNEQLSRHQDVLHANLGVHLKFKSRLQATREQVLLTFYTPFPNVTKLVESLRHFDIEQGVRLCRRGGAQAKMTTAEMCRSHSTTMVALNKSLERTWA